MVVRQEHSGGGESERGSSGPATSSGTEPAIKAHFGRRLNGKATSLPAVLSAGSQSYQAGGPVQVQVVMTRAAG